MRRRLPALLAVVLIAATACANVPLETKPQAIGEESVPGSDAGPVQPEKDLSASDVVRDFIEANAQSANNHETARQYLATKQARNWRPTKRVVILQENYNTIPVPVDQQPEDRNETRIRVSGEKMGALLPDKSFVPDTGVFETTVLLRRQPETRQWRIIEPPGTIITSEPEFVANHFQVPLYYFAPGSNVRVPDLRYIAMEPSESLPARVLEHLVVGPSGGLRGAVDNPLHNATIDTNVKDDDGALEVPLTGIASENTDTRRRIVTQVVMSLDNVYASRIRLLSDGRPVLPDRKDWRIGDVRPTLPATEDNAGHAVRNKQLVSLENGRPVPGPAGQGGVLSAAQSLEGGQIALVEPYGKGMRLRVGPFGKPTDAVDLRGTVLARPTWQPAYPGNKVSTEVWTVVDRKKVVRAQLTEDDIWSPQTVDSRLLEPFGRISALRLSRDGTRAAIVAGGKLVIASVIRSRGKVTLNAPVPLREDTLTEVAAVDWLEQDTLVATTGTPTQVVRVSVDGFEMKKYSLTNLEPPVTGIAATPDNAVIASNPSGLWTTSDLTERWQQHSVPSAGMSGPFYPG